MDKKGHKWITTVMDFFNTEQEIEGEVCDEFSACSITLPPYVMTVEQFCGLEKEPKIGHALCFADQDFSYRLYLFQLLFGHVL